MNILVFSERFPDEHSCEEYFRERRLKEGVVCKRCGGKSHYWLSSKSMFQCRSCCFRTSLKSGTVMENSKLGLRDWLMAMTFMSATKQGFSALELKRQMGFSRYETVFRMVHKIRAAMGKRDGSYRLEDMVEYDEAFVGTATEAGKKRKIKRGRGSQRKSAVAVMAESSILEDPKTGEMDKSCRYFKMNKVSNLKAKTAEKLIRGLIDKEAVLQTDESTTFADFAEFIEVHVQEISSTKEGRFNLKWVHTAISNLKNDLRKYRMVSEKYLQNYLDEFCYKLNRRYFGERLFDRLVVASIQPYWQDCG
jgi:hypothetical protein